MLRGACGQDLGAMGEVQVRGFIGKINFQFTAVVARDARRCPQSGTQLRTKRIQGHVEINTGVFSHSQTAAKM